MCRSPLLPVLAGLLLVLAARPARSQDALVPCYTCRTEECPSLPAPPCLKRKAVTPKPPRKDRARPPAPPTRDRAQPVQDREQPPVPPTGPGMQGGAGQPGGPSPPVPEAPGTTTPLPAAVVPVKPATPAGPSPGPLAPRRSASLRPWKWTTLIAGVVLAGTGAALLAVDGRSGDQCWMPGNLRTCQVILQTWPEGAALTGVGAAALVAAVVLFSIDARRERSHPRLAALLHPPWMPIQ